MNQSKHSLLRLLQIAEEKRILVIEPSLLNKDAEELTSSEDIYKLTLDNTEYRFVLNDAIKASSGVGFDKFEHINRGSKVINAVLDAVFGKYNSLVVRHAKFDPASIPNIDNIARPALGNGLSCHRISLALGAGSSSDYKIQVGLTVEIKDSITNGITIRKFLTHATVDFDKNTGNPHFDLKMVFQPENMDTDPTFEPVADINLNEFKEQIEIIRSFISKEETKREIFQGLIENDPDIRDYLHDRERKINPLIDSEPLVEFNIIPMSVSMNKVPKMTAQYQIFASEVAEPLAEVSTAEDFNPFEENLQVAYSCPHCGARCDKNNPLVEVINKDDAPAIGCLHCSTNDVASVYDFRNARFFIDELEREQADRFGNPFKKGQGDYYRPDDLRECYASHYRVYKGYTEEALDEHDRPVFVLDKYRTNDLSPIYGGKYYLSSLVAEDEEEPGQKYLIRDMGKCAITQKLVHKDRLVDAFKGADKQVVHVLKTLTEIGFNPGYHDGERYLSEALANDENTKKRYLKSDLRHDDTTGLLSYKETLIHFDYGFDQNGKELPKGGLCIPEHSSKCPNCQKIMGAKDIATRICTPNERSHQGKPFYYGFDDSKMACHLCCDKSEDELDVRPSRLIVKSEVSGNAFPASEKAVMCDRCGKVGREDEFSICHVCGHLVCNNCLSSTKGVCISCANAHEKKSGFIFSSNPTIPDEIVKYLLQSGFASKRAMDSGKVWYERCTLKGSSPQDNNQEFRIGFDKSKRRLFVLCHNDKIVEATPYRAKEGK